MRKYTIYLLVINILILVLLTWMGNQRYRDFKAYHISIAQESTASSAQAISSFIAEKKRLVALFVNEHKDQISQYMQDPEDDALYERLYSAIANYFPHFFTFTVADAAGIPVREDFEGYVGDLCKVDLKKFAEHDKQLPRIHPNNAVYHFDILAPLPAELQSGTLFISFHADILGRVLHNAQALGHQLLLIEPTANLIEVTVDGARIKWERDDYRLSTDEKNRILYVSKVDNTAWDAVDLYLPGLLADFRNTLVLYSSLIFMLFLLASFIFYMIVRREERLRIAAERNKDEFLAVVSHDLRTPITAIRGSVELINSGCLGETNEQMNECLTIASNNCQRISLLINDLLDLQKIEAGKMTFNIERQNLHSLVSQCIENNKAYAEEHKASFALQNPKDDIAVNVDASRFEQALSNLLSNAVKYGAKQDKVLISIEHSGGYACVKITDHGPGIPLSDQPRVFSRFAQLDSVSNTKLKGTGLGLSIVQTLIEKQGGRVGFVSIEGQGSTFYIELPIA